MVRKLSEAIRPMLSNPTEDECNELYLYKITY